VLGFATKQSVVLGSATKQPSRLVELGEDYEVMWTVQKIDQHPVQYDHVQTRVVKRWFSPCTVAMRSIYLVLQTQIIVLYYKDGHGKAGMHEFVNRSSPFATVVHCSSYYSTSNL
jgi:hypothetical protein